MLPSVLHLAFIHDKIWLAYLNSNVYDYKSKAVHQREATVDTYFNQLDFSMQVKTGTST